MLRAAETKDTGTRLRRPPEVAVPTCSALTELCFSQQSPEARQLRFLAWANSVCLVFILLATVGLKTPVLEIATPKQEVPPTVPVLFEPPPQQASQVVPTREEESAFPDEQPPEAAVPQIVPVVAPANADVAFAIPVEGPVILAPAQFAAPPPVQIQPVASNVPSVAAPVEFNSSTQDGGFYPEPDYPRTAIQRRMEGRVMLYVEVNEQGTPTLVQVRDSSGHSYLDTHAVSFVKRRWHWPAGATRHYYVPFRFQINRK